MSVGCRSNVCRVSIASGGFWAGSGEIWGRLVCFPMTGAVCWARRRVILEGTPGSTRGVTRGVPQGSPRGTHWGTPLGNTHGDPPGDTPRDTLGESLRDCLPGLGFTITLGRYPGVTRTEPNTHWTPPESPKITPESTCIRQESTQNPHKTPKDTIDTRQIPDRHPTDT